MPLTELSIVVPVRNGEHEIVQRVESLLAALADLVGPHAQVIVVDDGSQDRTAERIERLVLTHPQVRFIRHARPRGIEAAGQTGLERSVTEWVIIQEQEGPVCVDDLKRLIEMSADPTIVAARTETREEPLAPTLVRRLRLWGTGPGGRPIYFAPPHRFTAMQLIRRPNLQTLAGPDGKHYRLEGSTTRVATVQSRQTARGLQTVQGLQNERRIENSTI